MTVARTWICIYAAGFAVLTGFLCITLFTQAPFGFENQGCCCLLRELAPAQCSEVVG